MRACDLRVGRSYDPKITCVGFVISDFHFSMVKGGYKTFVTKAGTERDLIDTIERPWMRARGARNEVTWKQELATLDVVCVSTAGQWCKSGS